MTVFFDATLNSTSDSFLRLVACESLNCVSELFLLLNYIPLVYLEMWIDLLLCMICNIISLIIPKIMVQILQIFQMLTQFLNNIKTSYHWSHQKRLSFEKLLSLDTNFLKFQFLFESSSFITGDKWENICQKTKSYKHSMSVVHSNKNGVLWKKRLLEFITWIVTMCPQDDW